MKESHIELIHGNGDVKHAIIWLHGLGASANDFPPVVPELGLDDGRAIRFIFPQAPHRPITINGGMSMPGWYDIKGMNIEDKQDEVGMAESKALLDSLIEQQVEAVAYHASFRSKHKLAGVIALSTYLAFAEELESERNDINNQTQVLVNHGNFDQVVPIELSKMSVDVLTGDIGIWINRIFNQA